MPACWWRRWRIPKASGWSASNRAMAAAMPASDAGMRRMVTDNSVAWCIMIYLLTVVVVTDPANATPERLTATRWCPSPQETIDRKQLVCVRVCWWACHVSSCRATSELIGTCISWRRHKEIADARCDALLAMIEDVFMCVGFIDGSLPAHWSKEERGARKQEVQALQSLSKPCSALQVFYTGYFMLIQRADCLVRFRLTSPEGGHM